MRKDNFLRGTVIATFYIILTKIIGIIYSIPFHSIVGEKGGALYGYAYTSYTVFLTLSTIGIPLAISKIISEYDARGFYKTQKRVYLLARNFVIVMSCIASFILLIAAPIIAKGINGNTQGGNTVEDITTSIRLTAVSLVFVGIAGSMRGFLQGNKYISTSSNSQVIEQLVRVFFILAGGYLVVYIFKLNVTRAVEVAIFGATVGAVAVVIYLSHKIKPILNVKNYAMQAEEKAITQKFLMRKIIITTIPFVVVNLVDALYGYVPMLTLKTTMVNNCGLTGDYAESIMSVFNNWGIKLTGIVMAVAGAVTASVLPNLTHDVVSGDMNAIRRTINKILQVLCYTTIPMAAGLSLLAQPVWTIWYGPGQWYQVFMIYVLSTVFCGLEMNINIIMQSLNRLKFVYISSISGLCLNAIIMKPSIIIFHKLNLGAYNGVTFSLIMGLSLSMAMNLISLRRSHKVKYSQTIKELIICIGATLAMTAVILLLQFVFPISMNTPSRYLSIVLVVFYSIVGAAVYIFITYKTKTIERIFGADLITKVPVLNRFLAKPANQ